MLAPVFALPLRDKRLNPHFLGVLGVGGWGKSGEFACWLIRYILSGSEAVPSAGKALGTSAGSSLLERGGER